MKVKSRMSCPVRRKDGTWTTFIKEFEEDIPDLGREELICNCLLYTSPSPRDCS